MDTTAIRRAAREYLSGRAVLRSAFPDLADASLDALALVLAGEEPAAEATPRARKRQTTKAKASGRATLDVDVGGTRIPLLDAVIGIFQQKPRGAELTLANIVDEFKTLGWTLVTRNPDWTYPIRDRIKSQGSGMLTWRSIRRDGERYAREVYSVANARNIPLSATSREALDTSLRKIVQHLSTMN